MVGNNILHTPGIESQDYSPEGFGLDRKTVYTYRNRMFAQHETDLQEQEDTIEDAREKGREYIKESDGIFLYSRSKKGDATGKENGGYYFSRISQSEEYFNRVTKVEGEIFSETPELGKHLMNRTNHIELGPGLGSANKFKNYIHPLYLNKKGKKYTHYGFDVAGAVTQELAGEYDEDATVRGEGVNGDRFTTELFEKIDNKAYYILGGSIGNYEEEDVVRLLERLTSDRYNKGRPIVVSHFLAPTEPDKEQKKKAVCAQYSSAENKDFIFKGLEAIGVDTNKLEFAVQYEEGKNGKPDRVKIGAKLLEDMSVEVGNGIFRTKKAGDYIWPISSRRYTSEQFGGIAQKAGCTLKESRGKDGMSVALLTSTPKYVPGYLKIAGASIVGLLLILGIVTEAQLSAERQRREKRQKDFLEESFGGSVHRGSNIQYVINDADKKVGEVLGLLAKRYDTEISDYQKSILIPIFYDRIKTKSEYGYNPSLYSHGQMIRDYRLIHPKLIDEFVWQNKNILGKLKIQTVPNSGLVAHKEALENSYFYTGPRQVLDAVDQQLPNYVSSIIGSNPDGTPYYRENKVGLKEIDGKTYMVIQEQPNGPYVLEARNQNAFYYDYAATNGYLIDIIQQGEVPLVAEKIRRFLISKYGKDKSNLAVSNGQDAIVRFVTDLYAKGYNLSYLIGADSERYIYDTDNSLTRFVLGYVIPSIGEELSNGDPDGTRAYRMFDLDRSKIYEDTQEQSRICPIRELVDTTASYLRKYTSYEGHIHGNIENIILKECIVNHAEILIKDEGDMRCWITENREKFLPLGIAIPAFPDRVEEYLSYNEQDMSFMHENKRIAGIEGQVYTMRDGSIVTIGNVGLKVAQGNRRTLVLGQKLTPTQRSTYLREYDEGKYGEFVETGPRGASYPLTDGEQIINKITSKIVPYTSDVMYEMLQDYRTFKEQKEKYEQRKSR